MSKKSPKKYWFYPVRGSYLPRGWQGVVLYLVFVTFLITVLVAAVRTQHSVSDVFYMVFPQWIAATVVITWIASRTSK